MQRRDLAIPPTQIPASRDEPVASLEQLQKLRNQPEVIRAIGIAHDQISAGGAVEPFEISVSITGSRLVHDANAHALGDLDRAVAGPVVVNDDFPINSGGRERRLNLLDAATDRIFSSSRQGMTTETRGGSISWKRRPALLIPVPLAEPDVRRLFPCDLNIAGSFNTRICSTTPRTDTFVIRKHV